jgi:hypothetical protein
MNNEDFHSFLLYKAFSELLENPPVEVCAKLASERSQIETFLIRIAPEDYQKPSVMVANIETLFEDLKSEELENAFLGLYNSLNPDDIQNVIKKTGDPKPIGEIFHDPELYENEIRVIISKLKKWQDQTQDTTPQKPPTP